MLPSHLKITAYEMLISLSSQNYNLSELQVSAPSQLSEPVIFPPASVFFFPSEILQVILVQIPGAGRGFFTLPIRLQRLQKPYLSGTRTVVLAQTPGGGAQSLLNPPRRRPPPELGAFRARRRPRSVLQASEHPRKRQVCCERAFVLCSGLGLGLGHLGLCRGAPPAFQQPFGVAVRVCGLRLLA